MKNLKDHLRVYKHPIKEPGNLTNHTNPLLFGFSSINYHEFACCIWQLVQLVQLDDRGQNHGSTQQQPLTCLKCTSCIRQLVQLVQLVPHGQHCGSTPQQTLNGPQTYL